MTFEVQTLTVCDGWINIWHETGDDDITRPVTFDTREEAEKSLAEAIASGDVSDGPKNYRVAKAVQHEQNILTGGNRPRRCHSQGLGQQSEKLHDAKL